MKQALKHGACSLLYSLGWHRRADHGTGGCLTILMYHKICREPDPLSLAVTPEDFEDHIRYLRGHHDILPLAEGLDALEDGSIRGTSCSITFDDGYENSYSVAFPILAKYGVPATIFITVDAVEKGYFAWTRFDQTVLSLAEDTLDLSAFGAGAWRLGTARQRERLLMHVHARLKSLPDENRVAAIEEVVGRKGSDLCWKRDMLTWEQAARMVESGLVTIGSHTMTHPILSRIPREMQEREVSWSRAAIKARLGRPADLFAYPNGQESDFDAETVEIVRAAGYRAACTTLPGENRAGADPFRLSRLDVTPGAYLSAGGQFSEAMFSVFVNRTMAKILRQR